MARTYTKETCPLHGSKYCALLNMENCRTCTVNCDTEEKAAQVRADLDAICEKMPEDGLTDLFAGDECRLCKGEPQQKKWYALADLGHREPKRRKAALLGIAREPRAGTVLPVQIACCDACRRRYLMLEYVAPVSGTAFAALGLILMSVRSVREPIAAVAAVLPFLVFAAITAVGIIGGALIKKALRRKYDAKMHLDIMGTDKLNQLADRGWFELYRNSDMSRLVFSKTPIKQGIFTSAPEKNEESAENEENHAEKDETV